jgi:hypothetical protein
MPSFPVAEISYCVCDNRAVFLDIDRDRYFCLPSELNKAFVRTVVQGEAMQRADAERLYALGIGDLTPGGYAAWLNTPPTSITEIAPSDLSSSLFWAGVTQLLVQSRLKRWPFARVIGHERRRKPRLPPGISDLGLANLHAAFRSASLWLGEADQCLARSIAFRMLAFRLGLTPKLVMGVKLDPFSAHCWVQMGDCIANDRLERVRNFTPILAF